MEQRVRRVAVFVGAMSLVGGGLFAVACSTDAGLTDVPHYEGSVPIITGGDSAVDGGSEGGDGGVDADCTKNPVLSDYTNGFRCAFSDAGGRDSGTNCTKDETCCNTSDKPGGVFQPSFCATGKTGDTSCRAQAAMFNSTFDAGNAWECADKNACAAGQLCCMIVDPARAAGGNKLSVGDTLANDKNHPAACGVKRANNEGGSRCRTPAMPGTCPVGEIKLCSTSDLNCATGSKCTPFVDFQQTGRGTCL